MNQELIELVRQLVRGQEELRRELADGKNIRQEFFSVDETATIVGVSSKHILRAMQTGELSFSDIKGKGAKRPLYRISREAISAWLETKTVQPATRKVERPRSVSKLTYKFFVPA